MPARRAQLSMTPAQRRGRHAVGSPESCREMTVAGKAALQGELRKVRAGAQGARTPAAAASAASAE